ncbi:MAG: dihydroneopterin triphosphate diphosphatase [Lautropia sp.]|nr:dihydroneopterin triphosphate diphosphatase [Lautropia sp.]
MRPYKIPESVLVVIHTGGGQVLLMERADRPGFWQSVTGSLDAPDEPPRVAALREIWEETGLQVAEASLQDLRICHRYELYEHWRHRYAPGVTHNTEHAFALCLPKTQPVRLAPREHLDAVWLPWQQAAERCFSPSNAEVIRTLAHRLAWPDTGHGGMP